MHVVVPPMIYESTHHTCSFHERHPGRSFPGCTCSSSYTERQKPMSEWTEDEMKRYFAALRGENPDGTPIF